jgi:hypothetical protein
VRRRRAYLSFCGRAPRQVPVSWRPARWCHGLARSSVRFLPLDDPVPSSVLLADAFRSLFLARRPFLRSDSHSSSCLYRSLDLLLALSCTFPASARPLCHSHLSLALVLPQ